jgi:hypothetical protein
MIAGMTEAEIQLSTARSLSKTEFVSPFRTTFLNTMVRCVACFGSILFVGSIYAQSLIVAVSSGQFTTYVEAVGSPSITYPEISRTTTSASPISDEIDQPYPEYFPNATNHAIASAVLFVASVQTGWGSANASATSQLWFSPLSDQTQTIGIHISCGGLSVSDGGSVGLLDLTSNTELWNYSWDNLDVPANFPWDSGEPFTTANFNVDTDFLASHQYELTMITASQAGSDDESAQIQLTGLEVVPEPSTTLFLAMCGASFIISRRHRR